MWDRLSLGRAVGSWGPESRGSPQALPVKVTAGKLRLEDKQRLEQEQQSEEKRLAIMMMKKREKYLYKKIMFGKKRKVREVRARGSHGGSSGPCCERFPNQHVAQAGSVPICPPSRGSFLCTLQGHGAKVGEEDALPQRHQPAGSRPRQGRAPPAPSGLCSASDAAAALWAPRQSRGPSLPPPVGGF